MDEKSLKAKIERTLLKIIGPNTLNSDARKRLTEGKSVSVTIPHLDPSENYIEVKNGRAFLTLQNVTASVPFVPYDNIDENYFKSINFDGDELHLPDDEVVDAYFQRFEDAGFLF